MRIRFKLKALLLLFLVAAVTLTFVTTGLRHSYIKTTFLDNREIPDWWPNSWKAEYKSLPQTRFEHTYSFDETSIEQAVHQLFRTELEQYASDNFLGAPEIHWSHDGRSCRFVANGLTHRHFRASLLRTREMITKAVANAGWSKSR